MNKKELTKELKNYEKAISKYILYLIGQYNETQDKKYLNSLIKLKELLGWLEEE